MVNTIESVIDEDCEKLVLELVLYFLNNRHYDIENIHELKKMIKDLKKTIEFKDLTIAKLQENIDLLKQTGDSNKKK